MICNNCGAEINDEFVFCPKCGQKFNDESHESNEALNDEKITEVNSENNSVVSDLHCKECGKSISNRDTICPHCGAPTDFKKKKKISKGIIVLVIIVLIVIIGALYYYFRVWEGKFVVSQNTDTFELGSELELKSTLKYDPANIIQVDISNKGSFDTNKVGDYTVIFTVLNDRRNAKEFSFDYHVIDTVAPEVSLSETEIYIAKGDELDFSSFVSSSDASNNVEIKYDEIFDENKAADYELYVYGADESGNNSEKTKLVIHVIDRDNCDIRKVNFGEDIDMVKRFESGEPIDEGKNEEGLYYIMYDVIYEGFSTTLVYHFDENDKLCEVDYNMPNNISTGTISQYETLYGKLEESYGEPDDHLLQRTGRSLGLDDETLLWLQRYYRYDVWEEDDLKVGIYLYSPQANYFTFVVSFSSK